MTWGSHMKAPQDCYSKCANFDKCDVRKEMHNLAPILTAVDTMPDGTKAYGQIEFDCYGFKPKEEATPATGE